MRITRRMMVAQLLAEKMDRVEKSTVDLCNGFTQLKEKRKNHREAVADLEAARREAEAAAR